MIKNYHIIKNFERELIKKGKVDPVQNMRIVEALYHEAIVLGVLPEKDPLAGLEIDIKIARVVNSV